jgi:RNA polymerase primary sigma factor
MKQANDVLETINCKNELNLSSDPKKQMSEARPDRKNLKSNYRQAQARKKTDRNNSVRLYLQEIGLIPLLRPEEEIELARQIVDLLELERSGKQLAKELGRQPHERELAQEVKMSLPAFRHRLHLDRQAKNQMVRSNLRLVVHIAKKYLNRGLSIQDLIQEGNLGLIRAVERFEPDKGYRFSTYAYWWIRQAITQAIGDRSRTIRLPREKRYSNLSSLTQNRSV